MVNHDLQEPPQAHIGVVLDDEGLNVVSNSSSRAEFSRVASPKKYNDAYGRPGKFWRRPNPQGASVSQAKNQKTSIAQVVKKTGTSLSNISPPPGVGEVALLPLPLNQEAQVPTSSSDTGSQSQVAFSARDSNAPSTANTYGLA